MEQPFYGRTGLLVNTERAGLPVRHRRLHNIATPASAPLRWRPTLLTVPQKLLVAIREGEARDCAYRERASLGVALRAFVRVGLMVDTLARTVGCLHGPHSAAAHSYAQLSQRVLQWWSNPEQARWMHECGARQRKSEYGVGKDHDMLSSWFIPCYDLAVMTRPHSGSNSNSSSSSNTISSDSVGHNAAAAAPVTQGQSRVVGRLRAVSQRALTLFGKDKAVNDVPIDHDSCSGQHAAMFVQFSFAPEDELLSVCEDALIKYRMTEETVSVSTGTIGQAEASVGDVDGAVDDRSSGKNKAWSKDESGPPTRSHAAERRVAQNRESCRIDDSCVAFICTRLLHAVEQLEQEACQSSADGDGFAALWSLELLLMDLQSTNGTYVNGERLKPWTPWKLIEGDVELIHRLIHYGHRHMSQASALLREQADLLDRATAEDIKSLYFLQLKRNAQRRMTMQYNQWQSVCALHAQSTPDKTQSTESMRSSLSARDVRKSQTAAAAAAYHDHRASLSFSELSDGARIYPSTRPNPGAEMALELDDLPASVALRRSMTLPGDDGAASVSAANRAHNSSVSLVSPQENLSCAGESVMLDYEAAEKSHSALHVTQPAHHSSVGQRYLEQPVTGSNDRICNSGRGNINNNNSNWANKSNQAAHSSLSPMPLNREGGRSALQRSADRTNADWNASKAFDETPAVARSQTNRITIEGRVNTHPAQGQSLAFASHISDSAGDVVGGMQGETDEVNLELQPCAFCGRTFRPDRLARHETTCQRQCVARRTVVSQETTTPADRPTARGVRARVTERGRNDGAHLRESASSGHSLTARGQPRRSSLWENEEDAYAFRRMQSSQPERTQQRASHSMNTQGDAWKGVDSCNVVLPVRSSTTSAAAAAAAAASQRRGGGGSNHSRVNSVATNMSSLLEETAFSSATAMSMLSSSRMTAERRNSNKLQRSVSLASSSSAYAASMAAGTGATASLYNRSAYGTQPSNMSASMRSRQFLD